MAGHMTHGDLHTSRLFLRAWLLVRDVVSHARHGVKSIEVDSRADAKMEESRALAKMR